MCFKYGEFCSCCSLLPTFALNIHKTWSINLNRSLYTLALWIIDIEISITTHVEGCGEGGGAPAVCAGRLGDGARGDEAAEALLVRERVPGPDAAPAHTTEKRRD